MRSMALVVLFAGVAHAEPRAGVTLADVLAAAKQAPAVQVGGHELAAAEAQRAEDAASATLAGVLGWDPARPMRAAGALVTGDAGDLDAMRARLAKHPERAAALRRVDASEASLDVVLAQRWPMLAL